jgi:hypothetical protein
MKKCVVVFGSEGPIAVSDPVEENDIYKYAKKYVATNKNVLIKTEGEAALIKEALRQKEKREKQKEMS